MIDTTKFRLRGSVWRAGLPFTFQEFKQRARERGVFVTIDRRGYVWVGASLSRFAYGNNGILIENQTALDKALNALLDWLNEGFTQPKEIIFTRVDLCWHFIGDILAFIASHQGCTHPQIRGQPFVRAGESMWWGTKHAKMRIKIYDKCLESARRPGSIVRVEVTLIGYRLRLELAPDRGLVNRLDFDVCYRAFRRTLLRFSPASHAKIKPGSISIAEFVAIGEMSGWTHNGQSCLEIFIQHYTGKKRASEFRKKVAAAKPQYGAIRWPELLPESIPLPASHVGK